MKWVAVLVLLAAIILALLVGLKWAVPAIMALVLGWLARSRGRPGAVVQDAGQTVEEVRQGQAADAQAQQSLNARVDGLKERQRRRKGLAGLLLISLIVLLADPIALAAPEAPDWEELYRAAEADLDLALAVIDEQRALLGAKDQRIEVLITEVDRLTSEIKRLTGEAVAKDALIAVQTAQIASLQRPRWGVGLGAEFGLDGQADYSLRLIRAWRLLGGSVEYAIREQELRAGLTVFW